MTDPVCGVMMLEIEIGARVPMLVQETDEVAFT